MTGNAKLAELAKDTQEAIEKALEGAGNLYARLEAMAKAVRGIQIRSIQDRYEQAENAADAIERLLADLRILRAARVDDRFDGLKAWDFADLDRLEGDLNAEEDEETRGDRAYHEAKDEGRIK